MVWFVAFIITVPPFIILYQIIYALLNKIIFNNANKKAKNTIEKIDIN